MENRIPYISIIIPVYNGKSNYINECLESIWKQSIDPQKLEVICIDDFSTDNSIDLLFKEASNHSNLKVIQTEKNLRQGGARNLGINLARGEFIMFVDQDDYFSANAIKKVCNHLKSINLEVLVCDSAWQIRGHENNKLQHNFKNREIMQGDDFIVQNGIPYAPWKFGIKKSLIIDYNLFFVENVRIEDVDWAFKLTHFAKKIQYQPILLIHYNRGAGSTTWDSYKDFQTVSDTLKMAKRVLSLSNTIFANKAETQNKVKDIADFFFNHALRFMFGVNGKTSDKIGCIIENISKQQESKYFLVKLAKFSPFLYSQITILGFPFYRSLLYCYRKIKY